MIKMVYLPKFLYLFRTICLDFSHQWFKNLENIFSLFIWGYKRPHRSFRSMSLSKDRGGLSLPNLKLYYWSTIMTFCKALISRKQGLEVINETPTPQELVLGEDICGYLWRCPFDSYYKKVRFKTLSGIHNTWNNIRKLIGIGRLSYYTLISKNYNLPEPFRDAYMNRWVEAGITQLGHFFSGIGIKSFEELQRDYMLGNRDFFKYLQIRDFLLKKGGGRSEFQKVQVVELLNQNRPIKIGDIMKIY